MLPDNLIHSDEPVNPLLSNIRLPGESFQLPSRGLFYKKGQLAPHVTNGEVLVYPLTLIDEINLKSPDKLFSGVGLKDVCRKCIPDVLMPMNLLSNDIDFLMACLRKVTYGTAIEMKFMHNCENAKQHTYEVDLLKMIQSSKQLDPTRVKDEFQVTLPNGQVVHFHPSIFGIGVAKIHELLEARNAPPVVEVKSDLDEEHLAEIEVKDSLLGLIDRVDDIDDPKLISQWLGLIPIVWIKNIITPIATKVNDFGVDFDAKYVCLDCQQPASEQLNLNPIIFFS